MDIESVDPRDWEIAQRRAEILSKLPERPSGAQIRDAMVALGVGRTTLFRWLKLFREGARTSALLPRRRGPSSGMRPLTPEVLAIVEKHFRDFYATRRRPTVTRFRAEVAADCRREGLAVPSIRRLNRWLDRQDEAELLRRREGKGKSEAVFLATPGTLEAAAPLAIVQIDHTKVDVTVVDPVTRLPIGRPTLTLAIDVNTRMALGFHLSLDPPSLTAVALCLTHAAMDKTKWLAAREIEAEWPARGIPRVIHVDNGAEFHALAFERACAEHGIDLVFRPPGTPRFGGHIERLIGTAMGAVHLIPGSHFSNIRERGDLDPEREAVMTLGELETYFALEIVGAYHARIHRALEAPPVSVWRARIGEVAVRRPEDPRRFLIDVLPAEQRILRRDGLHLHHIRYWADELRQLVGRGSETFTVRAPTEITASTAPLFTLWKRFRNEAVISVGTLKYDPRDLSVVFVRVEEGYLEARPADRTRPSIALWEHRAALRALREAGRVAVDEELIFATILAQRALVDEASRATKAMRRDAARRPKSSPAKSIEVSRDAEPPAADKPLVLPYFEVEEWDE